MTDRVRPLREQDYADWLSLWQGYQAFYKVEIDAATTATTWSRLLDEREPMHAALSHDKGRITGLVHWIYHRSTWTSGDYCYLQDLFVAPDARKAGLGAALINFVYAEAARHGASRVYWLTHKTNEAGISLYRKLADESGFIQFRHLL